MSSVPGSLGTDAAQGATQLVSGARRGLRGAARRALSGAAAVGRALGVNRLLGLVVRAMPRPFRIWFESRRTRLRVAAGMLLVPAERLEQRQVQLLEHLVAKVGRENVGDYLEFGVYAGTSMACMYRALEKVGLDKVRLFGFDSFEGLPAQAANDDGGLWRPGDFCADVNFARECLRKQGVDMKRVQLVKGWFSDTCTPQLLARHNITRAGVIMIDCDMYLSAKQALDFVGPLIGDHAVILFDDWHSMDLARRNLGEKKAFEEFLAANPQFAATQVESYTDNATVFTIARRAMMALLAPFAGLFELAGDAALLVASMA